MRGRPATPARPAAPPAGSMQQRRARDRLQWVEFIPERGEQRDKKAPQPGRGSQPTGRCRTFRPTSTLAPPLHQRSVMHACPAPRGPCRTLRDRHLRQFPYQRQSLSSLRQSPRRPRRGQVACLRSPPDGRFGRPFAHGSAIMVGTQPYGPVPSQEDTRAPHRLRIAPTVSRRSQYDCPCLIASMLLA